MAKSFRLRMEELRDRVAAAEWYEDPRGIRRGQWLADFERLLLAARNATEVSKVALDPAVPKRVRTVAMEALGALRTKSTVTTLLKLLQDADDTISFRAASALCDAGQRETVPKLV